MQQVKKFPNTKKMKIIDSFVKLRKNRRHRPSRAFESVYYTFDLLNNFGMFRDFHRHRALSKRGTVLVSGALG